MKKLTTGEKEYLASLCQDEILRVEDRMTKAAYERDTSNTANYGTPDVDFGCKHIKWIQSLIEKLRECEEESEK